MKRARLHAVIKQLKKKGLQARCRFSAQLRVNLVTGVKTFPTLIEALPTLGELGVSMQVSEREKMEWELSKDSWKRQGNRRGRKKTRLCQMWICSLLYRTEMTVNMLR